MTDEQIKELLARIERRCAANELVNTNDALLAATALRAVMAERDEARADWERFKILAAEHKGEIEARAEAAEARLAEYEKALTDTLNALEYHFYKRFPELKSEPVDKTSIIGVARAALSHKGEG